MAVGPDPRPAARHRLLSAVVRCPSRRPDTVAISRRCGRDLELGAETTSEWASGRPVRRTPPAGGGLAAIEPFTSGLDLRPVLEQVLHEGTAFLRGALSEPFRTLLEEEVASGPIRPYRESFGQVRQQIEGFDLREPFDGFSRVGHLSRALTGDRPRRGSGHPRAQVLAGQRGRRRHLSARIHRHHAASRREAVPPPRRRRDPLWRVRAVYLPRPAPEAS